MFSNIIEQCGLYLTISAHMSKNAETPGRKGSMEPIRIDSHLLGNRYRFRFSRADSGDSFGPCWAHSFVGPCWAHSFVGPCWAHSFSAISHEK